MGANVLLEYLETLPAILPATRWFVQKLQGCVAGTVVIQLCVLCQDSSCLPPCPSEFADLTLLYIVVPRSPSSPSRDFVHGLNHQPVENFNTGTSQCNLFLSSGGYSVEFGK